MPSVTDTYKAGAAESKSLSKELAATRQQYELGRQALKSNDTPSKPEPSRGSYPQDKVNPKRYGTRPGDKLIDTKPYMKPLGSFKNGTPRVPKTGVYKLEKDEAVLNKKDAANMRDRASAAMGGSKKKSKSKKKKGRHVHEMNIRHSANGGYIARHSFKPNTDGTTPEPEEHTVPDVNSLATHVQDNMATPPPTPQMQAPPPGM